jgi:hypothetical protein
VAVRHFLCCDADYFVSLGPRMTETLVCSAKDCQLPARWALVWNNPKLHTPDRRKTWLACDGHRQQLADFLGARGFLRDVVPADEAPADPGPR